jgi:hypothetical protein
MKTTITILCALSLLLSTQFVRAQSTDIGNWMIYFGNIPLNEKWNIHAETQYRNYNFIGNLQQLLLRGGVGYNFSPNNHNLLLGYAYIINEPYIAGTDQKQIITEHRPYQQFIARDRVGRVFFTHRYRLEQRIFTDRFEMRARYFLALNVPINKSTMTKNALYFSAYDEVFLVFDSPYFDRNRLYFALGYVASQDLRFEFGYMWQRVQSNQVFSSFTRPQLQFVCFNTLNFLNNR